MKTQLLLAFCILFCASLACSTANLPGLSTPQSGSVLYKDDFSDKSSGWPKITDADGVTDYDAGFYRIRVDTIGEKQTGMDLWANPGVDLPSDVRIEVDATKLAGPDENDMGVICRYSKKGDSDYYFYYFVITSDGYVGIAKMSKNTANLISSDKLQPFDAIQPTSANHIRADCIGDKLTLYVNDQQAASATDSEYTSGDVGLIAGSFTASGVDIHFDNLLVTKP